VVGLQHRLARVKATADAGRPEQAQQAAAAIRREAEGLGYAPLIAAAWLIEGRAAHDAMAWPVGPRGVRAGVRDGDRGRR
jgi:hypothetical protein